MNEVATGDCDQSGVPKLKDERGGLTYIYARGVGEKLKDLRWGIINDNCRFSRDSAASRSLSVSSISYVIQRGDV